MGTALREVLALLDVRVKGGEQVTRAHRQIDSLKARLETPGGDDMFSQAMRRAVLSGKAAETETQSTAASMGAAWKSAGIVAAGALAAWGAAYHFALAPAVSLLEQVISLGDELDATSKQIGISTDELQQWRFIAERGNVDADALVGAMSRLQRQAFSAPKGFRALGVSVRGSNGEIKDASTLFRDVGVALSNVQDPAERAARAQALFGRQGRALLPIFADGEEGIEALIARFHELGGGLSEDVVKNAAGADDAMVDFRLAMTGMKGVLAANVLPVLTKLIDVGSGIVATIADWTKHSSILEVALFTVAGAAGVAALAFGAAFAPVIIGVGALVLLGIAIEDVVTAFRGGDSVFGTWVESIGEAMGVTLTFSGMLDALGIVWLHFEARALDAIAGVIGGVDALQRALGISIFGGLGETAAGMRAQAGAARSQALTATTQLSQDEVARRQERADVARARLEEGATAITKTAKERGSRGTTRVTHNRPEIHIHGATDPEAAARAVRLELQRVLREANDTVPVAEDAEPEPA